MIAASFALKLALVCAVVLAASVAARRFGHGVAGTLSGMPMIAGPIMGFVLLQAPLAQAHAIAVATVVAFPAMVSHMLAFALAARRLPWWVALVLANVVFFVVGAGLVELALPLPMACVLAAAAPWIGLRLMPAHRRERGVLRIPPVELGLRVLAAAALAAAIMGGASALPASVSGLLLALPITGNVPPCFKLTLVLALVLALALTIVGASLSYAMAWVAAVAVAYVTYRMRSLGVVSPKQSGRRVVACPIQGAVFADAQARLDSEGAGLRLLSVSIDPLGDDLAAMRAWLAKFGAQSRRWAGALPRVNDVDVLLDFLRGRAPGTDRHSAQAFVFDRQARLVYRTEDMPQPAELVALMRRVALRDGV